MTRRAGKQACNVGSFLRWQSCIGLPSRAKLALSLPIKGPSFCLPDRNGAGRSPEDRSVFFQKRTDAPILRRLTAPPPSSGRGLNTAAEPPPSPQAKANTTFLHNLSTQPAAVRQLQPAPSGAPLFNLPRSGQHNLRAQRARPLSGCAAFPLSPTQKAHRITDGLFLTV